MKLKIESGQRFGKLTVEKELEAKRLPSGQTNRVFLCKCDCGGYNEVRVVHLTRGKIISCGCVSSPYGGDSKYRLYGIWSHMKLRCSEIAKGKDYDNYYGRGITVCDEWKNNWFAFKDWALSNGYKDTLQLDREDNNDGYSPLNCRWVTVEINSNNRNKTLFINYKGNKEPIMMLVRRLGKEEIMSTIRYRILNGWNHDEAVDTPVREGSFVRGKGIRKPVTGKKFI